MRAWHAVAYLNYFACDHTLKIEKITVHYVALDYKTPFQTAIPANVRHSKMTRLAKWILYNMPLGYAIGNKSNNVVVKITTDQHIEGLGASSCSRVRAPPLTKAGETVETIIKALDKIAPRLVGMCHLDIQECIDFMDPIIDGNYAAKSAIDMALHDIWGKQENRPLYLLLGGYRKELLTDRSIGIKSPEHMAQDAVRAVNEGFRAIKIKVGTNPSQDIERVRRVREAVGEEIQLRVDANQGWTPEQAIQVLKKIEKFDIQFVEQPVSAGDIEGLKKIRKSVSIPIMADESARSLEDVLRLIQAEAIDMINIKLMKSGGILKAREIALLAEAAKIPCMMGCGIESEIGITAAAHVAAATRNIQFADLDSDLLLQKKLVKKGGAVLEKSWRKLPEKAGLGIEQLDEELLGKPIRIFQ